MDYSELDKAEQEKRKKDQIEYRNKRRFSTLFLTLGSIFEIIETLIIIFAGVILSSVLIFKVFNLPTDKTSVLFSIVLIVIFIGGLVLGFFVYKKVIGWTIKKFNLQEKLNDDVVKHYVQNPKEEQQKRQKR